MRTNVGERNLFGLKATTSIGLNFHLGVVEDSPLQTLCRGTNTITLSAADYLGATENGTAASR